MPLAAMREATNHNLKFWFEFRGAEFGLAPLSVEVAGRGHDMRAIAAGLKRQALGGRVFGIIVRRRPQGLLGRV